MSDWVDDFQIDTYGIGNDKLVYTLYVLAKQIRDNENHCVSLEKRIEFLERRVEELFGEVNLYKRIDRLEAALKQV